MNEHANEHDNIEEVVMIPRDRFDTLYPSQTPAIQQVINNLRKKHAEEIERNTCMHENQQNENIERVSYGNNQTGGNLIERNKKTRGRPKGKSKNIPLAEKIKRMVGIALKIAFVNGYDKNLNLISVEGQKIENTNIADLIANLLASEKTLNGTAEFIKVLKKANIDSSLIINERMKQMLDSVPKNNTTNIFKTVKKQPYLAQKYNNKRKASEEYDYPFTKYQKQNSRIRLKVKRTKGSNYKIVKKRSNTWDRNGNK